jgi:hypothetical protein
MISRTPTLAEWPYRMVRLACDLCPRCGQYRKDTLIARLGGDVLIPDVRHVIAQGCARSGMRAFARCPHSPLSRKSAKQMPVAEPVGKNSTEI